MATYYFRNNTTAWGTAANWSLSSGGPADGSVPSSADDVIIDGNSNTSVTVSVNAVCKSLTTTGWTGTLNITNSISVVNDVTLSSGTTTTGSSTIGITNTGSGTWLHNGATVARIRLTNGTLTLGDDWIVDTVVSVVNTTATLNGNKLYITSVYSGSGIILGSTKMIMQGTSLSGTGRLGLDLDIAPSSTLTIGNFSYGGGTMTYLSGTVTCTGTLTVSIADTTLDTNGDTFDTATTTSSTGINWNNITLAAGLVLFLTTPLCIIDTFSWGGGIGNIRNSDIYLLGNLTMTAPGTNNNSTSTLRMIGTGSWSGNYAIRIPIVFNTSGTITISGAVQFAFFTITYVAGNIVTTDSTLSCVAACTLHTAGVDWNIVSFSGTSQTFTLSSDLSVTGTLKFSGATTTVCNGSNINLTGSITIAGAAYTINGTTTLTFSGTGNWQHNSTSIFGLSTTINTNGTLTFTTNGLRYGAGGTLTYLSGTIAGSVFIGGLTNCSLYVSGITWNSVNRAAPGGTVTLGEDLLTTGNLSINSSSGSYTYNGPGKIYCGGISRPNNIAITGTSSIIFSGTGTWSDNYSNAGFSLPITIDTIGSLTISGSVALSNSSLTFVKGTVDTTGSTFIVLNSTTCTLDVNSNTSTSASTVSDTGVNFDNFITGGQITSASDIVILGNLTYQNNAKFLNCNTFVGGSLIVNTNVNSAPSGNSIVLQGTGSWTDSGTANFKENIIIDSPNGIITLSSPKVGNNIIVEYRRGRIISRSSLRIMGNATLLNFDKIKFDTVTTTGTGFIITMDRLFKGDATTTCNIVPIGILNIRITEPCYSDFLNLENCVFSIANGHYRPVISNKNGNKGGNANVLWENQIPNGFRSRTC